MVRDMLARQGEKMSLIQELRDYKALDMASGNANAIETLMRRAADRIEFLQIAIEAYLEWCGPENTMRIGSEKLKHLRSQMREAITK